MDEVMKHFSHFTANEEQCAFPSCECHYAPNGVTTSSMKSCAACGVARYCCKESQTRDWPRHKEICIALRPFKNQASKLPSELRLVLNSMTFKLPPIAEEYRQKYSCPLSYMFITEALKLTHNMVSSNLRNLLLDDDNDGDDMLKRWQELSPNLVDFLENASVGDVFLDKKYRLYDPGAPQQFRNTPLAEPAVLKNGTTVVDIGFVDFGIAFDSIDSIKNQGEPVIVLAYEMESFCVAKTMIMIKMMEDKTVNARSIVEVWLSSLWSEETLKVFKRATDNIVKDNEVKLNKKVKKIIEFWNAHKTISSEAALKFQMDGAVKKGTTDFAMISCSLAEKEDRVAYLRYYLTKALFEDKTTIYGSIIMNTVHKNIGVKQLFADCFETAPSRIHSPLDPSFIGNSTVISRTKSYFIKSMDKFTSHVRNGTLIFKPRLGFLSKNNQAMIDEIKAAKPYIISWSNVVDYIHPKCFHAMAKQMSSEDTAHYLHSCNWPCKVYGTDIYDIKMDARLHFFAAGLSFIETSTIHYVGFTKQGTYHFRDVCSNILSRKFVHRFFQYFFQGEAVNCGCLNGDTPLKSAFRFARTGQTAFIVFAYKNTGIDFGCDSYDYSKSKY